ncbi:hypothetical protein BGX24_008702 [Mortierella sp. AD032]|nr:hypothetical protein BGX24_008702 [Mortierella sp. AD032]
MPVSIPVPGTPKVQKHAEIQYPVVADPDFAGRVHKDGCGDLTNSVKIRTGRLVVSNDNFVPLEDMVGDKVYATISSKGTRWEGY